MVEQEEHTRMSLARPETDPNVTPRKLLLLAVPAILVGVVCALILWTLDRAADALSNVIWDTLPGALSVDPNGWWIILVLTVTGSGGRHRAAGAARATAGRTRPRPSSSARRCRCGRCPVSRWSLCSASPAV